MNVKIPPLVILLVALLCLVDHANANAKYWELMRRKCCRNPALVMCKTALEHWRFCEEARRKGGIPPGQCIPTRHWHDMSRVACRPGIERPDDWKDPDKPHRPQSK
ncbi:hypothetical protein CORC01_09304 [Colletotrichum orchidophilum]|uniref:Uncharacterized protein n=1 Tax=Colletotrichum orchidophilum TaxID=1209926 RepID=A0A1G4B297_9PEZI|nr:uncharacterized protein CORC01_09304 [Colletotrichum orchidophilum]OHE95432.1 hypothetical protein CORC01_09304 [Colletotrichum orchidophilum]